MKAIGAVTLVMLAVPPVISHHDCGIPMYDEAATCVNICAAKLKGEKVYAVSPVSFPVTEVEKRRPQERVCYCYLTRPKMVTDGIVDDLPPDVATPVRMPLDKP